MLILAFAETVLDQQSGDIRPVPLSHFPPLIPLDDWQLVEDDAFSLDSDISRPSYAEIAAQAGFHHEPVLFSQQPKLYCKKQQAIQRQSCAYVPLHHDYREDPWYQVKRMNNKHKTNSIALRRKHKTLEVAFRKAALDYLKRNRRDPRQKLAEARLYLSTVKRLQIELPPRYYIKGDRRISWRWGYNRGIDKYYSGRLQLPQFEDAFKDPLVREIVLGLIENPLPRYFNIIPEYDPEQWPTKMDYIIHCYTTAVYHDLFTVGRHYETRIIPELEVAYYRARRKWIGSLSHLLPSIKDKSICRVSRMQYARYVLRD